MTIYVWKDGGFVHKQTGERMQVPDGPIACPMVISDLDEYRSPIDGSLITSRSQQREDLKRNDCVLAEPRKRREYRNPKFALKRGLPLAEDVRDSLNK